VSKLVSQDKLNKLQSEEWYESLVEDCNTIIVEYGFASRWTLIEGYHHVGKRISLEFENFERKKIYGEKIVQYLAKSMNRSERTLYYALQFYKTFPDLALLPEGKETSWTRVIDNHLTKGKKKKKKVKESICPKCGHKYEI
jgi:hypothetical protein